MLMFWRFYVAIMLKGMRLHLYAACGRQWQTLAERVGRGLVLWGSAHLSKLKGGWLTSENGIEVVRYVLLFFLLRFSRTDSSSSTSRSVGLKRRLPWRTVFDPFRGE